MDDEATLHQLLEGYHQHRPRESATVRSVLRLVTRTPGAHPAEDLDNWLHNTPALRLYEFVSLRGGWAPAIAGRLPASTTYQRAYPRFLQRVIAFGEDAGLLNPEHYLYSSAWRNLMAVLDQLTSDMDARRRSHLRTAFRRLAGWATAAGFEPTSLPVAPDAPARLAAYFETFAADRDSGYYRARTAWNLVRTGTGACDLPDWCAGSPRRSMPSVDWPTALQRDLAGLFARGGLGAWRQETRRGYTYRLERYMGLLHEEGVDVGALLAELPEDGDALRLLLQGMPPGQKSGDALALASRFAERPEARRSLLEDMQALIGAYEGRASDANPFLALVVTKLVEGGRIASARDLLLKALAVGRGHLGLTDRHTGWIKERVTLLDQLAKRRPTPYALKKKLVFRAPDLWLRLVRARPRLRKRTAALDLQRRERTGSIAIQRRWAVALRNEVLFGLLVTYPLRANNVVGMKVGVNYDPKKHLIYFPAEETKNDKEIDYELPETGSLADLRSLVTEYLHHARPILLDGRASHHFFVPDPRGGTRMGTKAINAILVEISRECLADILPSGMAALNPHILRHAAATYHLAIGQNLNLAAQMLNDAPSTITRSYADVLENKKEATKRFLSELQA